MPHHGNEAEHGEEPIRFTDKRKIDPETGAVRGDADPAAGAQPSGGEPDGGAQPGQSDGGAQPGEPGHEPAVAGEAHDSGDALSQAEQILNAATPGEESPREAELREDLLRLQAEYVNYRKRVERDREAVRELAVQSVLASLLPVLDDLDAAKAHGDLEDGPFAAVARKLDGILSGHGLERIAEDGVAFDPNVHEALMQQPNPEIPADHVAQVLRVGYRKGERVIRAAQVIVSTGE